MNEIPVTNSDSGTPVYERRRDKIRRHSIFLLPNSLTITALFCAFYAITESMHGRFEHAARFIFLAMILDGMDGRVARLTNTQSTFGEQLDSLADMVSFGVAPALIVYNWQLFHFGKLGYAIAFIYCACAASRLALFNTLIGKTDKKWFIGIPSPTAAALIVGLVWLGCRHLDLFYAYGSLSVLLMTLFAGLSMVAPVRFWSFKEFAGRRIPFAAMIGLILLLALLALEPAGVLFGLFFLYSLSGYVLYIRDWWRHKQGQTDVHPAEHSVLETDILLSEEDPVPEKRSTEHQTLQ